MGKFDFEPQAGAEAKPEGRCLGVLGRLFGHAFEPVEEQESQAFTPEQLTKFKELYEAGLTGWEIRDAMADGQTVKTKTIAIFCPRCGRTLPLPSGNRL